MSVWPVLESELEKRNRIDLKRHVTQKYNLLSLSFRFIASWHIADQLTISGS